eukprot:2693122-Rhodomonas_salina.1
MPRVHRVALTWCRHLSSSLDRRTLRLLDALFLDGGVPKLIPRATAAVSGLPNNEHGSPRKCNANLFKAIHLSGLVQAICGRGDCPTNVLNGAGVRL